MPWFLEEKKISQLVFNVQFTLSGLSILWQRTYFLFLIAKESTFWVQTIIFTMKCIEIRKSFIEYCSSLEPTKAFACVCIHLIWTIYQSSVPALGGGEPKNQNAA